MQAAHGRHSDAAFDEAAAQQPISARARELDPLEARRDIGQRQLLVRGALLRHGTKHDVGALERVTEAAGNRIAFTLARVLEAAQQPPLILTEQIDLDAIRRDGANSLDKLRLEGEGDEDTERVCRL